MSDAIPASTSHALCVYAEALVDGRRVFVVDDASRGLGARLLDLGARTVHLYDPSRERAREHATGAPRGLTVRELPAGDFDVREGAFDLALIPDLSMVPEPSALLARVRRLIGAEGVVLVGAENAEARFRLAEAAVRPMDYYELYDLVALQFAHVRMIGLVPFVGVALAELGLDGAPEVSVDTQLAGDGDPPEVFVALASQDDTRLAEYAIVQLPSGLVANAGGARVAPAAHHVALAEAQLRASVLATQLEEARAREAAPEDGARLKEAEARATEHYVRAERVTHELRRLEDALGAADEMALALRTRLGEAEARAASREEQLALLVAAVESAPRVEVDEREIADLRERAEGAQARALRLEEELSTIAEASADELVRMEETLRERAQALKTAEHEVIRRERIVQELVASLEEVHAGHAVEHPVAAAPDALQAENDALRAKLDALALGAARREGEAATSSWRIAELEGQLATAQARVAPAGKPHSRDTELGKLEDELSSLRQALAQEHAARVLAESGEELTRARAELMRQATLIEQLSRELDAQDRVRVAREATEASKSA